MSIPNVLTIAGSDSGGGAGVQADLKTFSALGAYGLSVITAITAQNTRAVTAIHDVPTELILAQLEAVFDDIEVHAVKLGMLSRPEVIEALAGFLAARHRGPLVLDPVMVSKGGAALLRPEAVQTLKERLLPLATLLTPNLPEAAVLLGRAAPIEAHELPDVAHALRALGPRAVLLKGGHLVGDESFDILEDGEPTPLRLEAARIPTHNTHGTGCTLSSALAAHLAHGLPLREAAQAAKAYITGAIGASDRLRVGQGCGPVHHFYRFY